MPFSEPEVKIIHKEFGQDAKVSGTYSLSPYCKEVMLPELAASTGRSLSVTIELLIREAHAHAFGGQYTGE